MHAHVVAPEALGQRLPAGSSSNRARWASSAEALGPELLDQVAHPGQAPVLPVAELAEDLGDGPADLDSLVGLDEESMSKASRSRRTVPRRPAG